jgi:ketosteroid isomerase-like protein
MKNIKILLVLCAFLSVNLTIHAQTSAEKAVADAVESLRKLMIDPDKAKLEAIAATELSYGHSAGKIENKAEFVEAFVSGKSDFIKIDLTNQTIKVVGKTAIVRHKLDGETNDPGKGPGSVHLSVLTVWVKQKGGWKLLARQAVKV